MEPLPRAPDVTGSVKDGLLRWASCDLEALAAAHMLTIAGTMRNVERHAASWGGVLIGTLAANGLLEPSGDPLAALEELIALAARPNRPAERVSADDPKRWVLRDPIG